jgi:hypothetical protein
LVKAGEKEQRIGVGLLVGGPSNALGRIEMSKISLPLLEVGLGNFNNVLTKTQKGFAEGGTIAVEFQHLGSRKFPEPTL